MYANKFQRKYFNLKQILSRLRVSAEFLRLYLYNASNYATKNLKYKNWNIKVKLKHFST